MKSKCYQIHQKFNGWNQKKIINERKSFRNENNTSFMIEIKSFVNKRKSFMNRMKRFMNKMKSFMNKMKSFMNKMKSFMHENTTSFWVIIYYTEMNWLSFIYDCMKIHPLKFFIHSFSISDGKQRFFANNL